MIEGFRRYIFSFIFFSLIAQNAYSSKSKNPKDQKAEAFHNVSHGHKSKIKHYRGLNAKDVRALNKTNKSHAKKEKKDGTDIAYKRVAAEFEKQWFQIMWSFADRDDSAKKSFAQQHWQQELNNSIVNEGHELGDLGQGIYEELKQNKRKKRKNTKQKNGTK